MTRTARLIAVATAAALLAVACSSGAVEAPASTSPRPQTTADTTPAPATTGTADTTADTAAAPDVAAGTTTTVPAADSPTVTITDGPLGINSGLDEHGEGGVMRASWDVSPAEATCDYVLKDTNGNDAEHQAVVRDLAAGDPSRSLELLYVVAPDGLPLTLTISCRTADGAATVIGETVQIIEPGEEPANETDDGSADQTEPETTTPEIVRWDRNQLEALFAHCPPPYDGDVDFARRAQWLTFYDEYTEAHLAGRTVADKWPQPGGDILPRLAARLADDGYRLGDNAAQWARAEGIMPHRDISDMEPAQIAAVLHDWMSYRYQFAPEDGHAPAAWGLRIVYEAADLACVAATMSIACDVRDLKNDYLENPHLRYDAWSSSLGRALWSIVCGQAPTTERLGDDS